MLFIWLKLCYGAIQSSTRIVRFSCCVFEKFDTCTCYFLKIQQHKGNHLLLHIYCNYTLLLFSRRVQRTCAPDISCRLLNAQEKVVKQLTLRRKQLKRRSCATKVTATRIFTRFCFIINEMNCLILFSIGDMLFKLSACAFSFRFPCHAAAGSVKFCLLRKIKNTD